MRRESHKIKPFRGLFLFDKRWFFPDNPPLKLTDFPVGGWYVTDAGYLKNGRNKTS